VIFSCSAASSNRLGAALIRLILQLLPIATFLLAGCASLPNETTEAIRPTASVTKPKVAAHFFLSGRISVRVDDRLDSAKIVWERNRNEERLKFFSPFGSQLAEVLRVKGGATTMIQGGETVAVESIAQLTQTLLGVALETDEVARWVQGDGLTENVPFEFSSADGTVWRVTAEKFESTPEIDAASYRFASRLTATKGATRVRFVVDEWKAL
jgi:outer membrane biogenesis lipoprotein LolB